MDMGWNQLPDGDDYGEEIESLRHRLFELSTGRWGWDEIDCCVTGKDADLEDGGEIGLHLDDLDDCRAYATAHILQTVLGTNICLNLPRWVEEDEDLRVKCLEAYLDFAYEIVCDSIPGEWDGDSWILSDSVAYHVDTVLVKDGSGIDIDATADALVNGLWKSVEGLKRTLLDTIRYIDIACGWKDAKGRRLKCGVVSKHSAFSHIIAEAKRKRGKAKTKKGKGGAA